MKKFFKSHVKLCIAVLALSLVTVGATLALMVSQSNSVTNQFTAADIDTEIQEVLDDDMTKQVSITNQGRSDAYVRARIMVSGVVVDTDPEKSQVKIVTSEADATDSDCVYLVMKNNGTGGSKWTKESSANNETYSDDFYYYLDVLEKGESTENLLEKVVLGSDLQNDPDFLANFTVTIYHESVLAINQPAEGQEATLEMVKAAFTAAENSGN